MHVHHTAGLPARRLTRAEELRKDRPPHLGGMGGDQASPLGMGTDDEKVVGLLARLDRCAGCEADRDRESDMHHRPP